MGVLSLTSVLLWASLHFHIALTGASGPSPKQPGTWALLKNLPDFTFGTEGAASPILLTDGSVLVLNQGLYTGTNEVWKLVPDEFGSYLNGRWKRLAPFPDYHGAPFAPFGFASAVLPDGRVIFAGGEYNTINYVLEEASIVAIYDPFRDLWETIDPPSFCRIEPRLIGLIQRIFSGKMPDLPLIGDSSSVVLEDGRFMLGCAWDDQSALLDLETMTWTPTGSFKVGSNHEEGWVLLPDGKVLVVSLYVGLDIPQYRQVGSELYNPATGKWKRAANLVEPITNEFAFSLSKSYLYPDHEIGPMCLRPDGTVVAFGGSNTGSNAIYDTKTKRWKKGPTFPFINGSGQLTTADTNAALLPNGNILIYSGIYGDFGVNFLLPRRFWELTLDNELIPVPSYPDYNPYLLTLPTGQVLAADSTSGVRIYTPWDISFKREWAPVVYDYPDEVKPGSTYRISGKRFNGMSQGCVMGDDYQNASNYPLVRIINVRSNHVFYCATHHHSFMGVASQKQVHTYFDVPANIESGTSFLQVVTNGIPSEDYPLYVHSPNSYFYP